MTTQPRHARAEVLACLIRPLRLAVVLLAGLVHGVGSTPSAAELQSRVTQQWPEMRVTQLSAAIFRVQGILSTSDISELTHLVGQGLQRPEGTKLSENHHIVSLADPRSNLGSAEGGEGAAGRVLAKVNRKIAALTGYPEENIERGYFGVYFPGHNLGALHMGRYDACMPPHTHTHTQSALPA